MIASAMAVYGKVNESQKRNLRLHNADEQSADAERREVEAVEQLDGAAGQVPRPAIVEVEPFLHRPHPPSGDVDLLPPRRRPSVGVRHLAVDLIDYASPHGLGLANLAARASDLGGTFRAEAIPAPGHGTVVEWRVPLHS